MSNADAKARGSCCACCRAGCCRGDDVVEPDPAKKKSGLCACLRLRFYQYRVVTGMYVLNWWEAALLNVFMLLMLWMLVKITLNIGQIFSQYGLFLILLTSVYYGAAMYYNTSST